MDDQHGILQLLLGGNYVGPIHDVLTPNRDRRLIVVDIGTGMGQWYRDFVYFFRHKD